MITIQEKNAIDRKVNELNSYFRNCNGTDYNPYSILIDEYNESILFYYDNMVIREYGTVKAFNIAISDRISTLKMEEIELREEQKLIDRGIQL